VGRVQFGVKFGNTEVKFVINCSRRHVHVGNGNFVGSLVTMLWQANNEVPETYVARFFIEEEYLKAYAFTLEPINDPSEWLASIEGKMKEPPIARKLKSAPEQRREEQREILSRKQKTQKLQQTVKVSR